MAAFIRARKTVADETDSVAAAQARNLINVTIEDISRADVKAGILFTGTGAILGAVASFLVAGPGRVAGLPPRLQVPLLVSVVCAVAALVALGAAAYPRGVRGYRPAGGRVMYFGDVIGIADDTALREALGSVRESTETDLTRQLRQLSLIAYRKYRYIRVASLFLAVDLTAILATITGLLCGGRFPG